MKKILYFFAAAIAALSAVSCVEENLDQKLEIQLSDTELQMGAQGAVKKVVYLVAGAEAGAAVTVENSADWLEVSTELPRLIQVTASKNESGEERRAELVVSYSGCEDAVINVTQTPWEDPITITLEGTEATSVIFSVATLEKDFMWVGQIVAKEWYDSMESDEQIFQEDLSYYSMEANNKDISLADYLKTIINKGSYSNLVYKGLDPESDYVIYVYGITPEGERTTEIYTAAARTQPPYDGPVTFDIKVTEADNIMDITVTPDHEGVYYYWNIMDRATYDEYAAVHGDDPVAVFQAYVEWDIQDMIDYEDITDKSEYYEWFSTLNAENSQFECMALTEYIVFACKWDEDCKFEGEPEYVWHMSADVEPSDNKITVTLGDDIDQSSFYVEVKTTNNDPYVMLAEPSEYMAGMTDEQIFEYLMGDYGTSGLWYYVYEGSLEGRMTELEPDTEYTMVVFGYKAGKQTTAMQKFTVRTLPAGPAEDCKFEFTLEEAGSNSLKITVNPSDAAHYYYWNVYSPETTAEQVKEKITNLINIGYYGDLYEFSYYELSQRKTTGTVDFLAPETEYKVAAVVMDEDTGEFLADVIFSEVYKTGKANYSPTTVTASFDKFYNGDDLWEINNDAGAQYKGYALVPVSIKIDGEYKSYYYTIFEYETGLEDPEKFPDAMLYETLVYLGVNYTEKVNFRAPWNKAVVIAAMAIDNEGRYSRVYRQKYTFKKYNASDIQDFFTKSYGPETLNVPIPYAAPEQLFELKKDPMTGDNRFSKENVSKVKKENRLRKF